MYRIFNEISDLLKTLDRYIDVYLNQLMKTYDLL